MEGWFWPWIGGFLGSVTLNARGSGGWGFGCADFWRVLGGGDPGWPLTRGFWSDGLAESGGTQMTIDAATREEIERLNQAVDAFAGEMKARLREQALKGYRGWDDPAQYEHIVEMMMQHAAVVDGEEVDAANLAMILWSLRRRGESG